MNNRAFVFSGLALLLTIPTIILVASLTSMLDVGTTSVTTHLTTDKVFVLFENTENDLIRGAAISGRRAAVSAIDYQTIWNETLDSTYTSGTFGNGVCGAIKEMVINGTLTNANHAYNSSPFMNGNLLSDWRTNLENLADQIGYNLTLDTPVVGNVQCDCINSTHFYLRLKFTGEASDETGNSVYNGSFPRYGQASALVDASGTSQVIFTSCQNDLPVAVITSPSDGSSFTQGDMITLNGSTSYDPDNDLPLTFSWASDIDGVVSGSNYSTQNTSTWTAGAHTVTLTVTDAKGGSNSSSVSITINAVGGGGVTTTLSPPINDTYIDENSPATNYGSNIELHLKTQNNRIKRTLILFNLSSIPPSATINSAILKINTKSGSINDDVNVHRITTAWGESTATWSNSNNSFDSTILATNITQAGSISFNLQTSVQEFVDSTYSNYGWMIKYGNEAGNDETTYYSKEEADPGLWPVLTINYTP